MRTLEDRKPKIKPITNHQQTQQINRKNTRVVFEEPFEYKLQLVVKPRECITHEDSTTVKQLLIPHLKKLREEQPKNKNAIFLRAARQKVISFNKQPEQQSGLHSPHCIIGFKSILKRISLNNLPDIIVIYHDPKNYELFLQLFMAINRTKIDCIILKSNEEKVEIQRQMGVKVLNVFGLYKRDKDESLFLKLKEISMRCYVSTPQVFRP